SDRGNRGIRKNRLEFPAKPDVFIFTFAIDFDRLLGITNCRQSAEFMEIPHEVLPPIAHANHRHLARRLIIARYASHLLALSPGRTHRSILALTFLWHKPGRLTQANQRTGPPRVHPRIMAHGKPPAQRTALFEQSSHSLSLSGCSSRLLQSPPILFHPAT